ncbi:hypothetical protein Hanom_Chr10g00927761 [Helianthus anomalus]
MSYVPTEAESRNARKSRGIKRSAKVAGATPRKLKVRKIVIKLLKEKAGGSFNETEKVTEKVPYVKVCVPTSSRSPIHKSMPVQSEFRIATPPTSPVQQNVPIQPEVHSTPPQQTIRVAEPISTSKITTTPDHQSSSQSFPGIPSNMGQVPSLDDVGFFGDKSIDGIMKRFNILEKAKAESDEKLKATEAELKETKEKLKSVEAENVVLKNELTTMNEKVLKEEARINEERD